MSDEEMILGSPLPSQRSQTIRSPQERKELLRNSLERAQSLHENVSFHTIQALESIMSETDDVNEEASLDEKINHQDQVLLDSEVMSLSSNVLRQCTSKLTKGTSSYNALDFADKLMSYVRLLPDTMLEEINWSTLEDEIVNLFHTTPCYTTLLGALEPMEKKVIVRKQGTRDPLAATKRPEKISTVETDKESLEHTVEKINKLVTRYHKRHQKPLDFFRLILDPHDFGQTVENMLHVSFIVRDGHFELQKDESGTLVILPRSKEAIKQAKDSGKPNIQNVMVLNMDQWRTLKNIYRLEEPMINFDQRKK